MHIPVLLKKAIEYLNPKPGKIIVDATAGAGGHLFALADQVGPSGRIVALEWDPVISQNLKLKIRDTRTENVILENKSYREVKNVLARNGFEKADGILFDLGMSSWHIDKSGRGFTFQKDEPLDMRFNPIATSRTAAEIVKKLSEKNLVDVLKNYGGERFAKIIAKNIVRQRREKPIVSTFDLVEIIRQSVPGWYQGGRIHFATRTFQGLRIAVNDELESIKIGLSAGFEILGIGGRLITISFHSLEDGFVKNFFRNHEHLGQVRILTKKPIRPTGQEIIENPRARSARLRAAEKIAG